MRIAIFLLLLLGLVACKKQNQHSKLDKNTLTHEVTENDWLILFDGTGTDQWRGYLSDTIFSEWTVDRGTLKFTPSDKAGKNIITKKKFTNFILSLEWKISENGNSGIFWGVHEDKKFPEAYQTGPEIQVFGHGKSLDSDAINETHRAGSLFDMIGCDLSLINPEGEWNLCVLKIEHENNIGSVSMNGKEAFTFPVHGEKWDEMVKNSKFRDWKGFGAYKTGHIGLQDHSDKVWYKNIKIKEL